MNRVLPCAMTIAGSDSSGGAGVQADLKTFAALGVYATTVVTAVTAQDTTRVHDVFVLPARIVGIQFDAVVADLHPSGVKIGMLGSRENVEIVAEKLDTLANAKVVLDPVLASTSGAVLLEADAMAALQVSLLPCATLVTPNLDEAGVLTGTPVHSVADMEAAARRVFEMGARSVLVKGGHLDGAEATDVFFDGRNLERFSRPRLPTSPHGTGCVLSSAIAAHLALGRGLREAVREGIRFTARAIRSSVRIGRSPVTQP
jgi:hydroxymethylpyrimidine/phosphomethylpyrimidine kinase